MTIDRRKSPWQKEPMVWLIIALPATAIIGGIVTAWLASRDPDTLVSGDFAKQGLAVVSQDTAREARAASLGLGAELRTDGRQLALRLTGHIAAYPPQLSLTLVHPSRAGEDEVIVASAAGDGLYLAPLPALQAGKRQLILEPRDRQWRLTGHWNAPFAGAAHLGGPLREGSPSP